MIAQRNFCPITLLRSNHHDLEYASVSEWVLAEEDGNFIIANCMHVKSDLGQKQAPQRAHSAHRKEENA